LDFYPTNMQRDAMLKFADALDCVSTALRSDECGDPRLNGRRGRIYASLKGYQIYVVAHSAQAWTWAKKALSFAMLAQDGDEEGILKMDRPPTVSEAEPIRRYVGVSKKPDFTEGQLREGKFMAREPVLAE
jgi:hypothetical protein